MKIIYNRWIPFGSFWAINLCGVIFARRDKGELGLVTQNHEYIHTLQQREMLIIGFYLAYVVEWAVKMVKYRNVYLAYSNISFEREAYANQHNLNYKAQRPWFAWTRYLSM